MALIWRRRKRRRIRGKEKPSTLRHVIVGVVAVLLITALITSVWYLTRLQSLTLSHVIVDGGETVSHEEIRALAEQELTGTYFLLIPKQFVYTFPKDRIAEVLNRVPRVHGVEVERKDRVNLHITFEEYAPHALLCESVEETAPCSFLDSNGYPFSPAPPLRGGAFVRHVVEGQSEEGEEAITPELYERMDELLSAFESQSGVRVVSVVYKENGDIETVLGNGAVLKFAESQQFQDVLDNLESILQSEEYEHLRDESFGYIDLRFGNKVFVNETIPVEEEAATTTDEEVEVEEPETLPEVE